MTELIKEKTKSPETNQNQRLWEAFQARATLSQREFGEKYGIGTVSNVSQYLHGFRPLNLRAALKFARGLQVSLNEIAPELAALVKEAHAALDSAPIAFPTTGRPINVYSQNIAVYAAKGANAKSIGTCFVNGEDARPLIAIDVDSDDMQPVLCSGDRVLIDTHLTPAPGDIVFCTVQNRENAALSEYVVTGIDGNGKDIFELRPKDSRYPVFQSEKQEIKILGVAVEIRKTLRK